MLNHSSLEWFVVHTKARREEYAQDQLVRRGVATFLPWLSRSSPGEASGVMAPLFPSYLFVHANLEQQYWDIVWTPGVRRLVGFGGTASPVDDIVMEFLRTRADQDGIVHMVPVFREGDRVRINHGPLAGLVGIIEQPCSARGRVRVLMELLRRQTSVEVREELLDHVAL